MRIQQPVLLEGYAAWRPLLWADATLSAAAFEGRRMARKKGGEDAPDLGSAEMRVEGQIITTRDDPPAD